MKIIQRLKKWLHKEHGALIIESAFVYPIMFFVLMFLLYMGNMYYLKAKINSVVSQEAITYAARFADPNQEQFDKTIPTSNQGDTQVTKELYRYLDVFNLSDYGTASDVQKNELAKEIEDTGFYAGMTPANITVETHKVHNYVVYQTYEVTVNYQLKFPIRFIFSKDVVLLNMTAHEETPVIDTSEFIRNVDMAVDYVERTETGQSILTTLDNTYARIEKFIDGEKKPDPSEAVAGGSGKDAPILNLIHEDGLYTKGYDVVPKNSKYEERIKNCPANSSTNGHWTEERGESVFISDDPRVKDILDKYGVKGVEYKNGIPDFSPFAVAEVKISGMTDKRVDNFKSADAKLAEQLSTDGKVYTAKDIEKWRKENNYTWHELNDVETIQLVPTNINAPIFKHLGGCSEYKKGGK